MLKFVSGLIGLMLIFLSLTVACSQATYVKASLNQQIRLPVGQTVVINGENLSINFLEVTADSRCPSGVQCIWAGEAKCATEVTFNGIITPLVLTVNGSSVSPASFAGFTLNFNLEPYPQSGKTIDKNSYVMVLTVTK